MGTRRSKRGEEQVEEEQPSTQAEEPKKVKSARGRRSDAPPEPVAEPSGGEDSGDEAPEEVPMSRGKASATEAVALAAAGRAATEEARRAKRKEVQERNVSQKAAKVARGGEEDTMHGGASMHGVASGSGQRQQLGDDLLSDDVLAAIASRGEAGGLGSLAARQARMVSAALTTAALKRKKRRVEEAVRGPVVVSMLSAAARKAAAARSNFRRDALHGATSTVARSHEMLRPAAALRRGPAVKFT
ncbi:hypothetical protein FOA52_007593 [Chlamydomonas sp. UWO 241]|nr:hypothetical protein FOA52_007593 [Chlamydomonas sp. UWO 241]